MFAICFLPPRITRIALDTAALLYSHLARLGELEFCGFYAALFRPFSAVFVAAFVYDFKRLCRPRLPRNNVVAYAG